MLATTPMLDVSTAHISEDEARGLERLARGGPSARATLRLPRVTETDHGFVIWVTGDHAGAAAHADLLDSVGLPNVAALYLTASLAGAFLINLDQDGTVHDGLPTFDW